MNLLEDDYVEVLRKEAESKNFCKYRMNTEASPFFDAIWDELRLWLKAGTFDVYTKQFRSQTEWCPLPQMRSQHVHNVDGTLVVLQWTALHGGIIMELAVKKLPKSSSDTNVP